MKLRDLLSPFNIFTPPIMHLVYSPKFCITFVFKFCLDDCNTEGNWRRWFCKLLFLGGGGVNKVHYCLREKGNWILSQLMVGGVIGWPGHNVVWRVVVELRVELDLVPIPRHNMAAKSVVEKRIKSAPAMLNHAQVNNFNCIFFFGYYIQLLSVRANFVNVYGIGKCSFSSYLTSSSNILVKCHCHSLLHYAFTIALTV